MRGYDSKLAKLKGEIFLILYEHFPISLEGLKEINKIFERIERMEA